MSTITIFGKGNMGTAIGQNFSEANNSVNFIESDDVVTDLGDIIVLAVPYDAAKSIVTNHKADLAGKIVIDITNPVNFETWDGLVVPTDSSAAAEFAGPAAGRTWCLTPLDLPAFDPELSGHTARRLGRHLVLTPVWH